MDTNRIRCMVVDDAALMRATIRQMLDADPGIDVIDTAGSGPVALSKIAKQKPDVVTLDVEMPGMDGIELLRRVMAENPVPVVMLSSHTHEGAQKTLDALEAGAVDYVGKPTGATGQTLRDVSGVLVAKIKAAATANLRHLRNSAARRTSRPAAVAKRPVARPARSGEAEPVIAVGISAGGPATLVDVFSQLPADVPPILITQHMPPGFTRSFADRLNRLSALKVKEAARYDVVVPGQALIAPGHAHMVVTRHSDGLKVVLEETPPVCGHRPSVDKLFRSVVKACGSQCVGVIMTGMGNDGADALGAIQSAGAPTFAQNQESCVVFGMPHAAIEMGNATHAVDLTEITNILAGNIPTPA